MLLTTTEAGANKVRDYLREIHRTLENASFTLELMQPIVFEPEIARSLDGSQAGHAFNALQWGLYSLAAMDVCKVMDRDERSVTLVEVARLLRQPEVKTELRVRATTPIRGSYSSRVPPEVVAEIEREEAERHEAEIGPRFDQGLARGLELYEVLAADSALRRLQKARNKIIAHADAHWDGRNFRTLSPEDLDHGLQWGDPQVASERAVELVELWLLCLCCEDHSVDRARHIFRESTTEFWGYLKTGLASRRS